MPRSELGGLNEFPSPTPPVMYLFFWGLRGVENSSKLTNSPPTTSIQIQSLGGGTTKPLAGFGIPPHRQGLIGYGYNELQALG